MLIGIKFFNTEGALQNLTGLNHDQLWEQGFDLDDWDYGIQIPEGRREEFKTAFPSLFSMMENYCCGYEETIYNGYAYYLVYHS